MTGSKCCSPALLPRYLPPPGCRTPEVRRKETKNALRLRRRRNRIEEIEEMEEIEGTGETEETEETGETEETEEIDVPKMSLK